jgi:hypothetical protein
MYHCDAWCLIILREGVLTVKFELKRDKITCIKKLTQ